MQLINFTEKRVWETLDEMLEEKTGICKCERCRLDIAAMALNRLKPNYAVSKHGNVYARIKMLGQQTCADVVAEVAKALEQVTARPHHLE